MTTFTMECKIGNMELQLDYLERSVFELTKQNKSLEEELKKRKEELATHKESTKKHFEKIKKRLSSQSPEGSPEIDSGAFEQVKATSSMYPVSKQKRKSKSRINSKMIAAETDHEDSEADFVDVKTGAKKREGGLFISPSKDSAVAVGASNGK